jgi:hypothetical protein
MIRLRLDPRILVGEIDSNTPKCVVKFVADICGETFKPQYWGVIKYMNDFMTMLDSKEFAEIDLPLRKTSNNLQSCLHFLDPLAHEDKWEFKSVAHGIQHVYEMTSDTVSLSETDLIFGFKSNILPRKINEIIAYKICKQYNYNMNMNTEFEEMIFAIKKLTKYEELPLLRKTLIENIKHISNQQVVKFAYDVQKIDYFDEDDQTIITTEIINSNKPDLKNLHRTNNFLSNNLFLLQRIMPTDPVEAVILATHRFNICISEARSPLKQFKYLVDKKFNARNMDKYVPIDDYYFSNNYVKNPKWYFTNLNWFEELLPIYSTNQLIDFCRKEGFTESKQINEPKIYISYLESRKNTNWLYFGKVPFCNKSVTFIYNTPIEEIEPEKLICIGNVNEDNLEFFSLEELNDFLLVTKMFINPIDKEVLSLNLISKLKIYLKDLTLKGNSNRLLYTELLECIKNIETIRDLIDYKIRDLKISFVNMDSEDKMKINNFFEKCIDMAFYMRGWNIDGNTKLPLSSTDTYYASMDSNENPTPLQFKVFENVCLAYSEAMVMYDNLPPKIREDVGSLRIVKFSSIGEVKNIFGMKIKGMGICQNQTLLDCMYVSIYGDKDDESTCIRSNSNWILFSAAWYSYLFDFELKFRFDKIDLIS